MDPLELTVGIVGCSNRAMVFLPRALLREKMALKQARAVDAQIARSIYFRPQAILEDATGEPCWGERSCVLLFCGVAALLFLTAAYFALAPILFT